jgi:hypothetical protein
MPCWLRLAYILTLFPLLLGVSRYASDDVDPAQGAIWDLRPLFPNNTAWDREREQVEGALPGFAALKPDLGLRPQSAAVGTRANL